MTTTQESLMDDLEAVDPYAFHMQNEPHLNKTPIEVDQATGWRFTYRDIGMTRNATEENTKERKVFLDPLPHVVVDQDIPLRGWYKAKHEPSAVRPRPCYSEALLTQPYGGFCSVGCGFCYINNGTRGYRGQGITTVDPNYGKKIRKQISGMKLGTAVYMSSFIDPFTELEEFYHNTQHTAEAAVDAGLPIFFLTRKIVPGRTPTAISSSASTPRTRPTGASCRPARPVWNRCSSRSARCTARASTSRFRSTPSWPGSCPTKTSWN